MSLQQKINEVHFNNFSEANDYREKHLQHFHTESNRYGRANECSDVAKINFLLRVFTNVANFLKMSEICKTVSDSSGSAEGRTQ